MQITTTRRSCLAERHLDTAGNQADARRRVEYGARIGLTKLQMPSFSPTETFPDLACANSGFYTLHPSSCCPPKSPAATDKMPKPTVKS